MFWLTIHLDLLQAVLINKQKSSMTSSCVGELFGFFFVLFCFF